MAVIEPTAEELARWFVPGCYAVKPQLPLEGERGETAEGARQPTLFTRRAKLILACTEVPVALAAVKAPDLPQSDAFDPGQALAERCSQLWQAR